MKKMISIALFAALTGFGLSAEEAPTAAPAGAEAPAADAKGDNKGGSAESKKHRKDGAHRKDKKEKHNKGK